MNTLWVNANRPSTFHATLLMVCDGICDQNDKVGPHSWSIKNGYGHGNAIYEKKTYVHSIPPPHYAM